MIWPQTYIAACLGSTAEGPWDTPSAPQQTSPEVLIMEGSGPLADGLKAARRLLRRVPSAKTLILVSQEKSGAAGSHRPGWRRVRPELRSTPEERRQGKVEPMTAAAKVDRSSQSGLVRLHELSARQLEVLRLVAQGSSNKQIAARLSLSIKTVEKHRQQIMDRLNIHCTAGLTRFALFNGISAPG